MKQDFKCCHCGKDITLNERIGTRNRNHCSYCLWSLHVDVEKGDRKADCGGKMHPIGLTFKREGVDKYGKIRQGELMIIHRCEKCGKISINRIAGDDGSKEILNLFEKSKEDSKLRESLLLKDIKLLEESDREEVKDQLFGIS